MSNNSKKSQAKSAGTEARPAESNAAAQGKAAPAPLAVAPPPLFRSIDWFSFGITTLLVFLGYWMTLAPDLTLEDSGELAVASMYAGVPHPPGYPVWTIYTWLFTVLVPVSNIAFRVGLSSAVAGALGCGLIALLVSRGSSMMIEGIADLKNIERRWESALCVVSGFVAGMLMGFNGFMWSQAVIVEVYTLSVLSLMGVLVCLLRWIYAPHQRRYLYFAFFWFGITFNNHMSLLVVAMGLEIAILAAQPKLGRDLFFWNTLIWIGGLTAKGMGLISVLNDNTPLLVIYNLIGISSAITWVVVLVKTKKRGIELARDLALVASLAYLLVVFGTITHFANLFYYPDTIELRVFPFAMFNLIGLACIATLIYLIKATAKMGKEWVSALICGGVWSLGAAFYLYMPLAGMTNPPLNWGYPRTVTGFFHAFTRGQYERIHPTTSPFVLAQQIVTYVQGAAEEFNLAYLVIGLIPFFFYKRLQARERAWLIGLTATYFFLSIFLLILFNPASDRQSRDLNKVFFTASHVMIAMGIGYGLTLIGACLLTQYERYRKWALWGFSLAAALGLYEVAATLSRTPNPLVHYTAFFGLGLASLAAIIILAGREKVHLTALLAVFTAMPVYSILSHWEENEQHGHLFGYWFGHDMFTPPFKGPDGKLSYNKKDREAMMKGPKGHLIYPEMTPNTVLFGGTDPGRFNPTYMIFCESFIPPSKKPHDPDFDRRDVYLITQNALADGTYLSYIRAHYNRSTQQDPPFFQELLRGPRELELNQSTNIVARAMIPVDRFFTELGARIEKRRRAEGVYPPKEINTPSNDDSQRAFQEYLTDAQRRLDHDKRAPNEPRQLKPGEDVRIIDNKVQVSGQVAVMAINGLLTKIIFDKNPDHDFFVEESFPLDWMYPHLTPFGIIMKINREPVPEITEEMAQRDHQFWSDFSERLIGNEITSETTVSNLCAFAERVYLRRDYTAFKGDPKFVRDNDAQKAFSKLRSSIAGVYNYRIGSSGASKNALEQQRMVREAEFAFKQAYAFCPYSPEAVFRYINLLISLGRVDDARLIAKTSFKLDPNNAQMEGLIAELDRIKQSQGGQPPPAAMNPEAPDKAQLLAEIAQLEKQVQNEPTNMQAAYKLVLDYMQAQQTTQIVQLIDRLIASPAVDVNTLLFCAQICNQLGQLPRVEQALARLVALSPENPEAWFDLAGVQAIQNKQPEAVASLGESLKKSAQRRARDTNANDLLKNALTDGRFNTVRQSPGFQKLMGQPPK